MDHEAEMERAIKNLKILAKTAKECDVTLGLEVLNRYEGYMLNAFYTGITKEVQNVLMAHGYITLICSTNEDTEQSRKQVQMLLRQKVSGLLHTASAKKRRRAGG